MTDEEKVSPSVEHAADELPNAKPFPKLQLLKAMKATAAELIAAREKAVVAHNAKNIRVSGDFVESSVRKVLCERLPKKFHVGQGHIVNPLLSTSPQFDVIVANKDSFPVLFQDENETEWFPYEAVYAIGEVKSSYDKSKKYIEKFSENIRRTKATFKWPKQSAVATAYEHGGNHSQNTISFDQVLSFMVFVNSDKLNSDDISEFYNNTPAEHLPNIVYLVDKGVILNMKFGGKDGLYPMEINVYPEVADKVGLVQYNSKWSLRLFKCDSEELGLGMAFFTFYYVLMSHLGRCQLGAPSLMAYYALASGDLGPRMHFEILE